MLRNPKGVVVVTGLEDTDPNGVMFTMQTAFKKDFYFRANSTDEKRRFMEAISLAIEMQRSRFADIVVEDGIQIQIGIEFARNGFVESAKYQFQTVLEGGDANKCQALFHLGTCFLIEGNETRAVDFLQKARGQALLSDDMLLLSQISCNLGVAQYILGTFDESIKSFDGILEIAPGDEDAIVNESVVHLAAKNFNIAEKMLAPLLNKAKPNKNALLNWSEIMVANGKPSASLETLQRLVQLYPDCDEGFYKLGEHYEGERSETSLVNAAECYQSALALQSHRLKYGDAVLRVRNSLADLQDS